MKEWRTLAFATRMRDRIVGHHWYRKINREGCPWAESKEMMWLKQGCDAMGEVYAQIPFSDNTNMCFTIAALLTFYEDGTSKGELLDYVKHDWLRWESEQDKVVPNCINTKLISPPERNKFMRNIIDTFPELAGELVNEIGR